MYNIASMQEWLIGINVLANSMYRNQPFLHANYTVQTELFLHANYTYHNARAC